MINDIKNELLEELKAMDLPPFDPIHEVTAKMYGKSIGITERSALSRLNTKVDCGELAVHRVRFQNGMRGKAFYKPNKA